MTFDSHRATPGFGGIQIADQIGGNQAPVMATPAACDTRPVRSADGLLVAFRASHHRILDVVLTDIGG